MVENAFDHISLKNSGKMISIEKTSGMCWISPSVDVIFLYSLLYICNIYIYILKYHILSCITRTGNIFIEYLILHTDTITYSSNRLFNWIMHKIWITYHNYIYMRQVYVLFYLWILCYVTLYMNILCCCIIILYYAHITAAMFPLHMHTEQCANSNYCSQVVLFHIKLPSNNRL